MTANNEATARMITALKFGKSKSANKPTPPIAAQIIKLLRSFFGEMNRSPAKNEAVKTANKLPYSV